MIEFGGQKLLLDDVDATVSSMLSHYGTLDDIYCAMDPAAMHYGHQAPPVAWWRVAAASAPVHVRRSKPPRWCLNSLWLPTGAARVGMGLFLIEHQRLSSVLAALDDQGGATLRIGHTGRVGTTNATVTRAGTMYLLPPIGLTGELKSLYLLPLVDARWFWQFRMLDATAQSTVKGWSWTKAEEAVDNALSGLAGITWGDRDNWYEPDWFAMGSKASNAALYADALCASTGRRIIFSWEENRGYADTATTAMNEHVDRVTAVDWPLSVVHGGDVDVNHPDNAKTTLPDQITVWFDRRQGGYHEQAGVQWKEDVDCAALWAEQGSGAQPTFGSWTLDIHTTAQADFSLRLSTPGNTMSLNMLARNIASTYLKWVGMGWDWWTSGVGPPNTDLCAADDYWWFVFDRSSNLSGQLPENDHLRDEPGFFTRWKSLNPTDAFWAEQCQQFATSPMSRMATGLCRVELVETLERGKSAKAHVFYFDDEDLAYKADLGTLITVFDPLQRFGGTTGSRFWACVLPHDSSRFEIVGPTDDDTLLAYALLDEELCASRRGFTSIRECYRYPDCRPLAVDRVLNPYLHAGPKDAPIVIVRKHCDLPTSGSQKLNGGGSGSGGDTWEIIDVRKRTACAVMKVEDRGSCLTAAHHRFRGEWSAEDTPQNVCIITPINPCSPAVGSSSGAGSGSSGAGCDLSWTTTEFVCCGTFIDCPPNFGGGSSGA